MSADLLCKISNERDWYTAEKCRKPKVLTVGYSQFFQILSEAERVWRWDLLEDFKMYKRFELLGMEIKVLPVEEYFEIS